ncbi:RNA polymerase sigma factor [Hymenobacter negativus]|uniref:RNA polymerase sigma-70 factor n=1 Tax=Hymenobacter negativus TaxID=2795026 RepID=A0ABS3QLK5_9BACT|nr:RNA polymerase sigma-70 factor [Hymenobacter negativus]MBO2012149.1 RNA polymerase sigma-70 factor [Hymenobacter negativus]
MRIAKEFSDQECLKRLQQDDIQAFDQLFDLYAPELCRFAHGYLKSHADAEDAVQECFLKLWERRQSFDAGILFKAYLYKAAYHTVLKHLRRQRYWVFEECGEETLIEEAGPSQVIEYQELEQFYQVAMAQLPPRRREIFALNRQQGLSYARIAQDLNISVKCVENQMTHALKFLRLYFQAHGMSLGLALLVLAQC